MSWSRSLTGFAEHVERDLTERQKQIAAYALQQIIKRSPVDQGTYRGNHRVTVNGETHDYDLAESDRNGQRTLFEGMRIIGRISRPFGTVTIQNNLPYGEALEAGNSEQAPAGVYSVAEASTAARFGR